MSNFSVLELLQAMRSDVRADWKTPFKTLAFVVAHPILAWRWTAFLSNGSIHALWRNEPRLIDKPLRPYLNASWSVPQRLAAIRHHYDWLAHRFGAANWPRLFERGEPHAELARWPLGSGLPQVRLQLGYCGSFEREGDLTLTLVLDPDPTGATCAPWLMALTFGVALVQGRPSLCIGCVQARNHPDTMGHISLMTRHQHGMRPKALLIHVARELARRWHLELLGIDPMQHPFASLRYQMSRRKRQLLKSMSTSYEEMWQDAHGTRQADGWWRLPVHATQRPIHEIPSRKRSMYAHRQAWLLDLGSHIDRALQRLEQS